MEGMVAAITPVVRKMPEPMTLPTTKRMADLSPIARISSPSGEAGTASDVVGPRGDTRGESTTAAC